ncbi:MAG: BNR repeat-containing protein, partial [Prevotella sp.]|nr:BNR repeat-containing protein [Prevotella sp.]
MKRLSLFILISLYLALPVKGQTLIPVGDGWANNSVNTTVFRKNSLVTYKDTQFIAYYNPDGYLMLGKRKLNTKDWTLHRTQYKGNVNDAHNSISIMVDGDGYLHVSWDHHGNPLRYVRGKTPLSLELGDEESMTGQLETNVTYPEFHLMPNGDLIFIYRDGQSGSGNLVINHYNLKTKRWVQKQSNLIDGENKRNAYWQACVDNKGVIHISWVWRETWDVSTNHDLCYAHSSDFGTTWEKSNGQNYKLPITQDNAEYICYIPQNSELINQTSMTTDKKGKVYIASYWREKDSDIPQYHVVYWNKKKWNTVNLNFRNTPFSLKGGGTKRIPISRPQIVAENNKVYVFFRDEERGAKVSVAKSNDISKGKWDI